MLRKMEAVFLAVLLCIGLIPNISFAEENVAAQNFAQIESELGVKEIDKFIPYDGVELKIEANYGFYFRG